MMTEDAGNGGKDNAGNREIVQDGKSVSCCSDYFLKRYSARAMDGCVAICRLVLRSDLHPNNISRCIWLQQTPERTLSLFSRHIHLAVLSVVVAVPVTVTLVVAQSCCPARSCQYQLTAPGMPSELTFTRPSTTGQPRTNSASRC